MFCWKCLKKYDLEGKKLGFREVCPSCGFDLHVCKNCKYFSPGKPNDCLIYGTEHVSDRERFNFCEDFSPIEKPPEEKKKKKDILKKLFKDDGGEEEDRSFDSLFDD